MARRDQVSSSIDEENIVVLGDSEGTSSTAETTQRRIASHALAEV